MRVEVNGVKLYFDVDGEALTPDGDTMRERPTLILLHGGPGADHTIHKPAFSTLRNHAQLLYLDHRGNGRSDDGDPSLWRLEQWADDIAGLIKTLEIRNPVLCGTSFGGFVAQAFVAQYAELLSGLILISTAAKIDFEVIYAAFGALAGPEAEIAAREYWSNPTAESRARYREICVPHYTQRNAPADWIKRARIKDDVALHFNGPNKEMGRMDFRSGLAAVNCPTLVMVGDKDPMTPPVFSDEIATSLSNAKLRHIVVEGAGHGVIEDRSALALIEITGLLDQVEIKS